MSAAELPIVEVFSRPGCHLCEILVEELAPLVRGRYEIVVRNIDSDAAWREQFGLRIPVVRIDGREICQYKLDKAALLSEIGPEKPTNQAS